MQSRLDKPYMSFGKIHQADLVSHEQSRSPSIMPSEYQFSSNSKQKSLPQEIVSHKLIANPSLSPITPKTLTELFSERKRPQNFDDKASRKRKQHEIDSLRKLT